MGRDREAARQIGPNANQFSNTSVMGPRYPTYGLAPCSRLAAKSQRGGEYLCGHFSPWTNLGSAVIARAEGFVAVGPSGSSKGRRLHDDASRMLPPDSTHIARSSAVMPAGVARVSGRWDEIPLARGRLLRPIRSRSSLPSPTRRDLGDPQTSENWHLHKI
jgi:hypothetical protein